METLLVLGGFHPDMPLEEARNLGFDDHERYDRLVVGDVTDWEAFKRLGYSHKLLKFLGKFEIGGELPFDPGNVLEGKVAARIRKYDFDGEFDSRKNEIINILEPYMDGVDLRNPDTEIYFFLTQNEIYCGKLLYEFDSSEFFQRKSGIRPFSRPISLPPRESRCWVNLSGVEKEGKLLDPFCGTGGILIEAGLVGCDIYGSDSEGEMVSGCEINLDYYNVGGELKTVRVQNLSDRWDMEFDAIVTDPPYGRATKVGGKDIEKVYRNSLREFDKVLKEGGRCVVGAPESIDFKSMIERSNFEVSDRFREKVHKSLVREIFVLD